MESVSCLPAFLATIRNCLLCLLKQILPGVRIIIANPETKGPLGDSHLGEVSHTEPSRDVSSGPVSALAPTIVRSPCSSHRASHGVQGGARAVLSRSSHCWKARYDSVHPRGHRRHGHPRIPTAQQVSSLQIHSGECSHEPSLFLRTPSPGNYWNLQVNRAPPSRMAMKLKGPKISK